LQLLKPVFDGAPAALHAHDLGVGAVIRSDAPCDARCGTRTQVPIQMCDALSRNTPKLEGVKAQLAEHKTEPNSGLGKAISYLLNHWPQLTLFLQQPGAPIDNHIAERALKKAILNRENALFYRTLNGAGVGDLFMSLIHTCELNGANPFDYLTELQRHAAELKGNAAEWMPWNYRETLAQLAMIAAA
jgi:hypothetical protein